MPAQRLEATGAVVAFLLVMSPAVDAQTTRHGKGFIAGRVGANLQAAEDGENGASFGGGVSGAAFLASHWAVEFDAWIPAYIEQDGKRFRDLLFSVSALRMFGGGRVEPYILAGFTVARVQLENVFGKTSNGYSYVQAGGGVALRLGENLSLAPEVRVNLGVTSNIGRPSLVLLYRFR